MDPLTILALAKASYEAIKTGISVGKEMQGMFGDVMSLLDSAGKLSRLAAQPPRPGLFEEKTAEQIAIEAFTAKAEVEHYEIAIATAEVSRRFILVETDSAHALAWRAALDVRQIPAFVVIPRPGCVHPITPKRRAPVL